MTQRPDYGARIAVVAALAGLGLAYWLGAQRAGELGFAADGVRRHEARLDADEKVLEAHGKVLAEHAARLETHDRAISTVEAAAAAAGAERAELRGEVRKLRAELDALKAEDAKRDDAFAKLLERIERLEAMKSPRMD
ncbi:MAG TPA: hypothetical protein VHF22_12945 [Planctomycetota bacterium]|nr:hypothetical protein [Planctomycetota bacterium]